MRLKSKLFSNPSKQSMHPIHNIITIALHVLMMWSRLSGRNKFTTNLVDGCLLKFNLSINFYLPLRRISVNISNCDFFKGLGER